MGMGDISTYTYNGTLTVTVGSPQDCELKFHGETEERKRRDMSLANVGYTFGKAAPYGSMHYENGHWVIGDVNIDDMITKIMGGTGGRVSGVLLIEFRVIPSEVTSGDTAMGGPFEVSEPARK